MVKHIETFTCETCGTVYSDRDFAARCEAQPEPTVNVKVGDFVGFGVHGWWGVDHTWALVDKPKPPSRPDGPNHPTDWPGAAWRPPTADDVRTPVVNWWLPIWKVIAIRPGKPLGIDSDGMSTHRLEVILWSPHHANGNHMARVAMVYGDRQLRLIPADLAPTLTPEEADRYAALVADPPHPSTSSSY